MVYPRVVRDYVQTRGDFVRRVSGKKTGIKGSARITVNSVHRLCEDANKQGLWVLIKLLFSSRSDPHKYAAAGKQRTAQLGNDHRDAVK